MSSRQAVWWMIGLLLLATVLAAPHLNVDAYTWDEVSSLRVAGGAQYGPFTLSQAWAEVASQSPDQAVGNALLLSVWGQAVGWTEFATRVYPLLAGLLAITLTYRAGRDLFSPFAGMAAAGILATSAYFIIFMHQLRIFTTVALVVALTVWCYWHILYRPPRLLALVGLIAGGIGLLYTHYFAAPLLGALGLYHVLLAPKNRRWWRPVLAMLIAGLAFIPELAIFLNGLDRNIGNDYLRNQAMSPGQALASLGWLFSNTQPILLVLVGGIGLLAVRQAPMRTFRRAGIYVALVTLALLVLIIGLNAWVQVMLPDRTRYLMALWPLLALLVGFALAQIARWRPPLALSLLAAWLVVGVLNVNNPAIQQVTDDGAPGLPWRELRDTLQSEGQAEADLFVFMGIVSRMREFYAHGIPMQREIIESWDDSDDLQGYIEGTQRVWLGTDWRTFYGGAERAEAQLAAMEMLLAETFTHCQRYLEHADMTLDLYGRVPAFCPGGDGIAQFGDAIALNGLEPLQITDGQLVVQMGWQVGGSVPPETYSVGVHVYAGDELVAQADFGLPTAPFGPASAAIDLSDLPEGDYAVRVLVYDWRNGTRLPTETGDFAPLGHITVGA